MVGQRTGFANVNFDYNGPPVLVTNGMALDLVSQFGTQNAWYAFLKLRGLTLAKSEADKALALKRFRNKIRQLRRNADLLRNRNTEYNNLLGKEFSAAFIESSIVSSSTSTNEETSTNLPASKKTDESGVDSDINNERDDTLNDDEMGKLVIDEEIISSATNTITPVSPTTTNAALVLEKLKESHFNASSIALTTTAATGSDTVTITTANVNDSEKIKTNNSLLTTATETNTKNDDTATIESIITKRHQETIDDVVSSVMEKIRNNLPLEGESSFLNIASTSAQNNSASSSKTLATGSINKGRGSKGKNIFIKNNTEDNKITFTAAPNTQIISNPSHLISNNNATTFLNGTTSAFLTTLPAGQEHLALSTIGSNLVTNPTSSSNVSLQQPLVSDQVTILSNFTEIIRASTSQQATTSQLAPVTKIITHGDMSQSPQHIQQQQFQHQITHIPMGGNVQFPSFTVPLSTANSVGGIPIGISPQGTITLPNNITVQSLLQSLQQQNKKQQQLVQLTQLQLGQHQLHQNQAFQLHFQPAITNNTSTIQQSPQQQILPDSSSQDIGGNSINLNAQISHGPSNTILTKNINSDLKTPKKRQYIKRKGAVNTLVTNTDSSNNFIGDTINSVLSSQQKTISESDINVSKKIVSVDTLKITEINTNPKSSSSDSKKVSLSKFDILTTKEEDAKIEVDLKNNQSGNNINNNNEKLTKKKTNPKKNKIEVQNTVEDALKNNTKEVIKTVKSKSNNDLPPNTPKKVAKAELSANILKEKKLRKISELEKELAKCQKQLNIEKNKFIAQKKKLDKLQIELEKTSDQIQLVQIDLACQKTDNNSLAAQNIALKAELQKYITKESNKIVAATAFQSGSKIAKRKKKNLLNPITKVKPTRAGVKRQNSTQISKASSRSLTPPKEEHLITEEPVEYGRRQSKRVCVTRKSFLFSSY